MIARHDEGDAPASVVDEVAGDQRRTRHAQVAPHAVDGDAHARVLPLLHHEGEADRVVDRGKHADHEQADADLQRRAREGRGNRGEPDADEEHAHHALAAPLVREPAGRQREHAEREEPGCCVFQEIGIAEAPLAVQRKRRHGGEDQREQMIQEVPEVEQQEVQALAHEGSPWPDVGRPCAPAN